MNKEEVTCQSCEAESYIESNSEIYFCPHCGSDLEIEEEFDFDEELSELDEDN